MSVANDTQGRRIRAARLSAGFTQAQLARAVQTSERNIVRWENDRNAPRFEHVTAIARATGKDVEFFTPSTDGEDDDEEAARVAPFDRESILDVLIGALQAAKVAA